MLDFLFDWLVPYWSDTHVVAVGHRVVQGGAVYAAPVLVDAAVLAHTHRVRALAPLHQPHNRLPVRTLAERRRKLPQVAKKFGEDVTDDDICNFLLTSGGCAIPAKINTSFSRAEVGCGFRKPDVRDRLREVSRRDRRPDAQRRSDGTGTQLAGLVQVPCLNP